MNVIEPSVCGGEAALCQVAETSCYCHSTEPVVTVCVHAGVGLRSRRRSRLKQFLPSCQVEMSLALPRLAVARHWHSCCQCLDMSLTNQRWRMTTDLLVCLSVCLSIHLSVGQCLLSCLYFYSTLDNMAISTVCSGCVNRVSEVVPKHLLCT